MPSERESMEHREPEDGRPEYGVVWPEDGVGDTPSKVQESAAHPIHESKIQGQSKVQAPANGDIWQRALDAPIDGIAERDRIREGLRARVLKAAPEIAGTSWEWIASRAAELVAYGVAEPRLLDKALGAYLDARRNRMAKGRPITAHGPYLHTVFQQRFGAAWKEWREGKTESA
ncbi:MAG TPA: hypothetical protein VMY37_20655 [Thermoguttaceae bacterium]|nr:hypothetical protein [Thermoguttaceae bacterium]